MKEVLLVGVDCAVDPANTGLCRALYTDGGVQVLEGCSGAVTPPVQVVSSWLGEQSNGLRRDALLGLDAPLGWPAPLGEFLGDHRAGAAVAGRADALFRRYTDDFTRAVIGKRPMDVGADRIARTAHSALTLLNELRAVTGLSLPLGWTPGEMEASVALETYPAAFLTTAGLPNRGYKRSEQRAVREQILEGLGERLSLECPAEPFLGDADILDALLCVLVCAAYLEGEVVPVPEGREDLARREGWIWLSRR